jgi:NAD(P)-dependent dehydrogenase (short-subunit alcohol dehydrogenase family)
MPGNEITGAAALVTGASRGFGRGIATALSKAGRGVRRRLRRRQGSDAAPSTGGPALTPEQAGQAIADLTDPSWDQDAYLITAAGIRPLP